MKNLAFFYLFISSGVFFLIVAGAFYTTENSNLTPVSGSIGFVIISIGFVLLSQVNKRKNRNS